MTTNEQYRTPRVYTVKISIEAQEVEVKVTATTEEEADHRAIMAYPVKTHITIIGVEDVKWIRK